jgi:two-component system response regulator PilR (NtrC family)
LKRKGFDLCLTALKLPDGSGLDLVRMTQKGSSSLPVAVMAVTDHNGSADLALKHGAFDFLYKPIAPLQLQKAVESMLKTSTYAKVERRSRHRLLGDSFTMREIRSSQQWSDPCGTHGKRIFRPRER